MKNRTFKNLVNAKKLYRKLYKQNLKSNVIARNGSKVEVDIVKYFETGLYVVLFGYEMDNDNARCILNYSDISIEWDFVSMLKHPNKPDCNFR